MRRLALFFAVLLVGALSAAAPALGNTDWAVNGTPLAPGQEVPVKFASITPIQLLVPQKGIEVTCASWKSKGVLVGGDIGTGELFKPKLTHCTINEAGKLNPIKVHITPVRFNTDLNPPPGTPATGELVYELCFAKSRCEPVGGAVRGTLDGIGPSSAGGNLIQFPQSPLPATTLTFEGSPAEMVGEAVFTLHKQATLTEVEL